MLGDVRGQLAGELAEIDAAGLHKAERLIGSPQRGEISVAGDEVINLCANNYLGLADHPEVIAAAHEALDRWGYGMASVRFICGTQEIHVELERRLAQFLGTEETILYSSCFDANGGVFETLLGAEDAVISDALNHASIIDGIRLCKARRLRYANGDMDELEARLGRGGRRPAAAHRHRRRLLDGRLPRAARPHLRPRREARRAGDGRRLARRRLHRADRPRHAGAVRRHRPRRHRHRDARQGARRRQRRLRQRRAEIVDLLRQRSRPYLFSNALAPPIVAASLRVLDLLERGEAPLDRLRANTDLFRREIAALGFEVLPGDHPIVPVMFGDAARAAEVADRLLAEGLYVIAFSYPVVPMGAARIRTQMSAAHDESDLRRAIEAFAAVR